MANLECKSDMIIDETDKNYSTPIKETTIINNAIDADLDKKVNSLIEEDKISDLDQQKKIKAVKMKRINRLLSFVLSVFIVIFIVSIIIIIEVKAKARVNSIMPFIMNNMVKCPAGIFEMGSPSNELGKYFDEKNLNPYPDGTEKDLFTDEIQHSVTISRPFYIGKYEVTQKEYEAVMGRNPSYFKGENNPVESVNWYEAMEFCKVLNKYANNIPKGYKFDLPTEAQWEYACRAGTNTSLNNGKNLTTQDKVCPYLDELAWYFNNSDDKTHPVGQKKPNSWGLYDMHGNVWEWCKDWYGDYPSSSVTDPKGSIIPNEENHRVIRGGCYIFNAKFCRSAHRGVGTPKVRTDSRGFRIVLVAED